MGKCSSCIFQKFCRGCPADIYAKYGEPFIKDNNCEWYIEHNNKHTKYENEIDKLYGEGKWKIIDFTTMKEPITLEHHCGEKKVLSRAITMRRGSCTCECELKKNQ